MRFDIDKRVILAVGINAESPYLRDYCVNKLFNALLDQDLEAIPGLFKSAPERLDPSRFASKYRSGIGSECSVTLRDGNLSLQFGSETHPRRRKVVLNVGVDADERGMLKVSKMPDGVAIGVFNASTNDRLNIMIGCRAFVATS